MVIKKLLRWILILPILIVIILGYVWLSNPNSFPIKTVRVEAGYTHLSPPELQKIIVPFTQQSFFGLRAAKLKAAIQKLPLVGTVNVRRKFPATIVVSVVEKQPILIWNKTSLMTAQGVLFTPDASSIPKNLPALFGPTGNEQLVFSTMGQINQALLPLNLTVRALSLSPRGSWTLQLSNGIEVFIGQQALWPRLQQFVKVYPEVVGDKVSKVVSVDLRYPNGVAVMWKH